jgi:uncharacterized MAPEG superfamily protein
MTFELTVLLAILVLSATMWLPFIIGVNMHMPATAEPFRTPFDTRLLPAWVQRANRAHMNLLEQGMPFAGLVILAHLAGVSSIATI